MTRHSSAPLPGSLINVDRRKLSIFSKLSMVMVASSCLRPLIPFSPQAVLVRFEPSEAGRHAYAAQMLCNPSAIAQERASF